jgi:DNA polymerase III alpha subunit
MAVDRHVDEHGRTIIEPHAVYDMILQGMDTAALYVGDDPMIDEYNKWCAHFDKPEAIIGDAPPLDHSPEEEHRRRAAMWFIPEEMKSVDVRQFLLSMTKNTVEYERVNMEMDLFEERGLIPLLQLMMYLIDHFRRNNVVWGVGRGSSVASFCLYLIGVHKIDPIRHNLDIHEFLK